MAYLRHTPTKRKENHVLDISFNSQKRFIEALGEWSPAVGHNWSWAQGNGAGSENLRYGRRNLVNSPPHLLKLSIRTRAIPNILKTVIKCSV